MLHEDTLNKLCIKQFYLFLSMHCKNNISCENNRWLFFFCLTFDRSMLKNREVIS